MFDIKKTRTQLVLVFLVLILAIFFSIQQDTVSHPKVKVSSLQARSLNSGGSWGVGGADDESCSAIRINPFGGTVPPSCATVSNRSFIRNLDNPLFEDTDALPDLFNPLEQVDNVVEKIITGSLDTGDEYSYMQQYCVALEERDTVQDINSTFTANAACAKLEAAAPQFRKNISDAARQGDPKAQTLLAIDMVREVYAARNKVNLQSDAGKTSIAAVEDNVKWDRAMEQLRMASLKNSEAANLLNLFQLIGMDRGLEESLTTPIN